ncbi:hypothetical protein EDB85DRAFT_421524 [Lactarius pseudohatsudake]|nr:hypothetical protein EDB85DRAFT_421524 [Lactarius pseudohatsudake]
MLDEVAWLFNLRGANIDFNRSLLAVAYSELPLFKGLSLTTISSTGSNGDQVYLCDSGGATPGWHHGCNSYLAFRHPEMNSAVLLRACGRGTSPSTLVFPNGTSDV